MTEQQKNFPEFYVTAPQPCPYLNGRFERKLFTHLTHDKPRLLVDNLLKGGFRRSQNIAYLPYCDNCQACVSVRVRVADFAPGRSFRRILDRNRDLAGRQTRAFNAQDQFGIEEITTELAPLCRGCHCGASHGFHAVRVGDLEPETHP